jgi:D-3-phosphoglycerate dehydrogenase
MHIFWPEVIWMSSFAENQTVGTAGSFKILICKPISHHGIEKLKEKADVHIMTDLTPEQLLSRIAGFDALIVGDSTQVTREVLAAGTRLKVVGKAGSGLDNIDVDAATARGIVVVKIPESNIIARAEHTIAMMTSLARNIPPAVCSLKAGEWKRSRYTGMELYKKTLGLIGIGRTGSEVKKRAAAMGMKIIVYDPYIPSPQAEKLGVELVTLEELCARADIISLHAPLTPNSYHVIGEKELAMMKDGVRIINCTSGGLIDENSLLEALQSGKVAGAALDVFENEPALDSPLLNLDNVIATPHVADSTEEAQANVSLQVSEQVLCALQGEPVAGAINLPVLNPEMFSGLKPFLPLMRILGSFYPQVFTGQVREVEILYSGDIASYPVNALTNSFLVGLLSFILHGGVNYVNAPLLAGQRGIRVREATSSTVEDFTSLVTVNVKTDEGANTIAGTLFNKAPRIVQIGKHRIEVSPSRYMIVTSHLDIPGVIGSVGTLLGKNNVNIAGMQVGRESIGGEAVMVIQVDNPANKQIMDEMRKLAPIAAVWFVQLY